MTLARSGQGYAPLGQGVAAEAVATERAVVHGPPTLPVTVEHVRLARGGRDGQTLIEIRASLAALMLVPEDSEVALHEQVRDIAVALEMCRDVAAAAPGKFLSFTAGDMVRLCERMTRFGALSTELKIRRASSVQAATILRAWLDPRLDGHGREAPAPSIAEVKRQHPLPAARIGETRRAMIRAGDRGEEERLPTTEKRWARFRSIAHLRAADPDVGRPGVDGLSLLPNEPSLFAAFLLRAETLRRGACDYSLPHADQMWKLDEEVVDELLSTTGSYFE